MKYTRVPKKTWNTKQVKGGMLIKCPQCGLCYMDNNTVEQKVHIKYHKTAVEGINVGSRTQVESFGKTIEKFLISPGEYALIIEANNESRRTQRIVEQVLSVADLVLNSQDHAKHWRLKEARNGKVFVCIYKARVIGICSTETPQIGSWMIAGSNIIIPNKELRLPVGIDRIFVIEVFRRRGIATKLLNAVTSNSFYRIKLKPYQIGWSQPSHFGELLAKKYSGVVHPRSGLILIPVYKQENI